MVARIVCQVLHRADRVTFLWSEGMASFEPYHLEGAKRASLVHLAGAIHERLAEADGVELVQMGHQLYRAVFCLDESDPGSAGAIRTWLTELISANAVER